MGCYTCCHQKYSKPRARALLDLRALSSARCFVLCAPSDTSSVNMLKLFLVLVVVLVIATQASGTTYVSGMTTLNYKYWFQAMPFTNSTCKQNTRSFECSYPEPISLRIGGYGHGGTDCDVFSINVAVLGSTWSASATGVTAGNKAMTCSNVPLSNKCNWGSLSCVIGGTATASFSLNIC